MTSDRSRRPTTHRRLEVVKPMTNPRTPQEIAELFTIAGRETEAIQQLTGCVEQLHEVQAAKRELASLTPAEVRAALESYGFVLPPVGVNGSVITADRPCVRALSRAPKAGRARRSGSRRNKGL